MKDYLTTFLEVKIYKENTKTISSSCTKNPSPTAFPFQSNVLAVHFENVMDHYYVYYNMHAIIYTVEFDGRPK